nr:hypothetical protein [Tanacetum cinerariifolium]
MKNSLYGYFIGERLAFSAVECHSLVDCPKAAPTRVVNSMEKGKGQSSRADDEGGTNNSPKTTSKTYVLTSGNGTFSLSNSFDALNVDDPGIEEVESDDDSKPLKKGSEDKIESVDNEMASHLASKLSGVGYGTKSLLEQRRKSYGNADVDYNSCDDDMYEGQEIHNNIQSICDNLDIKICGRKNK